EARDHHGVFDRDRALVIIAVQRPGLHLTLVELAAVQQAVERMQAVIAGGADVAQRCLEFRGIIERHALADRIGAYLGDDVHNSISVPSAGICQPAFSAILRSAEPCSSAGLELLICRNTRLSIATSARLSIAPLCPDIEICPMPWPVL